MCLCWLLTIYRENYVLHEYLAYFYYETIPYIIRRFRVRSLDEYLLTLAQKVIFYIYAKVGAKRKKSEGGL